MGPGPTAFTRMPSAAWSAAIPRVSPATAALVVSYWVVLPILVTDRTEATLTMLLGAACRRSGIAAFAQNAYPLRFTPRISSQRCLLFDTARPGVIDVSAS